MRDPAQKNRLIELAKKAVQSHHLPQLGRDRARIDEVLDKLREVWLRNPEMRLAQLVFNAAGASQPCPEIFYLEDAALLRGLASFESQEPSGES